MSTRSDNASEFTHPDLTPKGLLACLNQRIERVEELRLIRHHGRVVGQQAAEAGRFAALVAVSEWHRWRAGGMVGPDRWGWMDTCVGRRKWLRAVCNNAARAIWRVPGRRNTTPLGDFEPAVPCELGSADLRMDVSDFMSRLDDEQRMIVAMILDDAPNTAIAHALGVDEKTVRRRRAQLRERLWLAIGE